jgi:hypothetical protein
MSIEFLSGFQKKAASEEAALYQKHAGRREWPVLREDRSKTLEGCDQQLFCRITISALRVSVVGRLKRVQLLVLTSAP